VKRGDLLIELILAIGLFAVLATTAIATMTGFLGLSRTTEEVEEASLYAQEGLAATRAIRDQSWDNLTDEPHGLSWTGTQWVFSGTSDQRGKFVREVSIKTAQRDSSGNLVDSGGSEDPDTKIVLVEVSWDASPTRHMEISLKSYLTNWREARLGGTGVAELNSCDDACQNSAYSSGNCRMSCQSGESVVSAFNSYCNTGISNQVCCCGN